MSKNTKDILIIVGISLLVILVITSFLIYKKKGKEEVLHVSGNSISNDETETQENILTETEQEIIEKEIEEGEDEKTEEIEKEEVENKKPNNTNKDTTTNNNKDNNNASNNQSSISGETINTVKKLSKPQNVKWSESKIGLLTWSPVQYADEYKVEIFKDGVSIGLGVSAETSCEIKELIKQHGAGIYTVKIKAHSNVLLASDEVTTTYTAKKLSKPENVKWSETKIGLVTWSSVQYADEYKVEIFKDGASIGLGLSGETSCEIEGLIKQHGVGTYTVKIKANSNVLPSSDEVITTYTAKQLSKPENVKWSETKIGLVTWSSVQYADEYKVEIFKDGASIGLGLSGETSCEIEGLIKQHGAGTYTVKIKANSNVLPSSDEVITTYTAKQLSKPQNVKWSETKIGLVTWSPVQYADEYKVEIFKDGVSIGLGFSGETSCEIEGLINQFGAGTYTVKIKANSNVLPSSDEVTTTYTV